MNARDVPGLSFTKKAALTIAGVAVLVVPVVVGMANAPAILGQSASGVPQWQAAAGGQMSFEVASVRQVKPGSQVPLPSFTFPLDDGDAFKNPRSGESPHGRFASADPLSVYITFAYKLSLTPVQVQAMMAHLPKWARTDRFEIVAKAAGDPTKDQMRLMMQSLLAERFHLRAHYETQEMPVYALTLIKPGTWGPKLIRHADGPPCDASTPAGRSVAGDPDAEVFPRGCDVLALVMRNGRMVTGSRNTTMPLLAAALSGKAGRPVIDRSGITDRIDYRMEWTPESNGPGVPGEEVQPDPQAVTWMDALREQLGLKLESTKGPVQTLVIDHVERPSGN